MQAGTARLYWFVFNLKQVPGLDLVDVTALTSPRAVPLALALLVLLAPLFVTVPAWDVLLAISA